MDTAVEVGWRDPCGLAVGELRCAPAVSDQPVVGCAGCPLVDMVDFAPVTGCVAVGSTMGAVPALLRVRFPWPPFEPDVRLSPYLALHGICRWGGSDSCDRTTVQVFHLHSINKRLTAHAGFGAAAVVGLEDGPV
ncbi:hypothetical protein X161_02581 [Mycobacterium tuberculosis BTB09-565]|uniref:hypothetical protein n=1 Tax=Mycobacterium tuberculosis TaxID=1773 RepID=UPI000459847B|nr:hypothetical protein [Mycobacterium tuberculosis]KCB59994.1 hypothetical protein X161_02581 [Mycobacterium tuberculosis BTB09-565]